MQAKDAVCFDRGSKTVEIFRSAMVINLLISISFVLFMLGIFSPLMTVKKWLIFENTFSLLSGLMDLFHAGQYILLIIVAVLSLVIPLVKMFLLMVVTNTSSWAASERQRIIHWLSLLGKWSMIDVFIVAIVVVVGKFRGMAEVEVHYGLYAFAASVILLHIATCGMETGGKRGDIDVIT
jgi:paraquat-inducible protein A